MSYALYTCIGPLRSDKRCAPVQAYHSHCCCPVFAHLTIMLQLYSSRSPSCNLKYLSRFLVLECGSHHCFSSFCLLKYFLVKHFLLCVFAFAKVPSSTMSDKLDVEEAVYASSSREGDSKRFSSFSERPPSVSRLSPTDHSIICQSIGALSDDENHKVCQPTSYIYPPKGLPNGLYKDVIRSRTLAQYEYCKYFCFRRHLSCQYF